MFTIMTDSAKINDLSFPRCTGVLFEYAWGYHTHTNCQDILAEALREYRLTPDDVHDSFNFWMNTRVEPETGRLWVERNTAKKGDYVELIAHFDILAVVSVCGADLFNTSNFALKPLRLSLRDASPEEQVKWLLGKTKRFTNQKTVADFKVKEIRAERELSRDPAYLPEWPVYPITTQAVEIELDDDEYAQVEELRAQGRFGSSDGEVVRYGFFGWCLDHEMQPDPFASRRQDRR
jgi:hypothetical protein